MSTSITEELTRVLIQDNRCLSSSGELLKNKVLELAAHEDSSLIKAIYGVESLRGHFFTDLDGLVIFNKERFQQFLVSKEWLPDSFTAFKNKIGMAVEGKFLSESADIVLDWAFKDCVLEGGMKKGEANRQEVFYNEVLAPDEVNRLLAPKAFKNPKRISASGEVALKSLNVDEFGIPSDNLIVRGNNLLAISSLKEVFANKVRFIYIDPPYNTEQDLLYNDRFRNSTWLTLMKNRLDVARALLSEEGLIFVQIDSRMFAHLKILMDEIFGSDNLKSIVTVKVKGGGGVGGDSFLLDAAEYILCYSKDSDIELEVPREEAEYFPQEESDYVNLIQIADDGEYMRTIEGGNVGEIKVFKHEKWSLERIPKEHRDNAFYVKNLESIMSTTNPQGGLMRRVLPSFPRGKEELFSIEYTPMRGKNKGKVTREYVLGGRLVIWLKNVARVSNNQLVKLQRPLNIWDVDSMYKGIHKEGGVSFPNGKKPEHLIKKIFELHAKPGDLVLDFFLGSGTTAAVAHKMGLRYIGVEQLNYGENDVTQRLKNVIAGDATGISKSVGWKGGGEFVYLELAERNPAFHTKISEATSIKELEALWREMSGSAFLAYKVDIAKFNANAKEFAELDLREAKAVLFEALDKNAIYVNLSEVADEAAALSESEISVNKQFYGIQ